MTAVKLYAPDILVDISGAGMYLREFSPEEDQSIPRISQT
jgi:hypothetical protein